MYFEIFDKDEPKFNRKLANRYLLVIKRGQGRQSEQAKLALYRLMKKVIVKNVNNYSSLSRNSPVTEFCLDETEMYSEAYLVMVKCVDKFKVNKKNCFYFYFNKSLSRNFYRMFDKEIRKFEGYKGYSGDKKQADKSVDFFKDGIYSVEFVAENLDLDEFDKLVLKSKMEYQKKDDFIVNTEGATIGKYYASIRKIKKQVQKLKDNGDI